MGLPFPSRPKVSSSEKVARLNTHFPDFYPLCYSLDKVAEIHLAALFRLLPLAFLALTLFCLPFFSDPREKAWKLFYCRMFLLTVHLGVSGVIHGHAFTAEVVDLFLEIISRH